MRAAYLYGAKDLRLKETGTPEINDNEILMKVKSAAICILDVKSLISERFTLDRISEGVQRATRAEGLKNIIYFE